MSSFEAQKSMLRPIKLVNVLSFNSTIQTKPLNACVVSHPVLLTCYTLTVHHLSLQEEMLSSSVPCRWKHVCPSRAKENPSVQIPSWEHCASTKTMVQWRHRAFVQTLRARGPARWRHALCTLTLHDMTYTVSDITLMSSHSGISWHSSFFLFLIILNQNT